jgi:dihydropteroate synthase
MFFRCGKFRLSLDRPLIMGVVNITPDSFSDGGRFATADAAIAQAHRLIDEGADILDFGGESTRPGSDIVPLDEERRRILPVLDALRDVPVPLSVDTQKPQLMREAIAAGAAIVAGLSRKSALGLITGRAVNERVPASIAAMLIAVQNGAHIVRVHDVATTRDALMVLAAVQGQE